MERKQHAVEVIQLETAFYEQAETKLNGVEPLLLQMNPGDPTPAEKQMQEAEVINMEAERLVAAAANLREEANNTKKKKLKSSVYLLDEPKYNEWIDKSFQQLKTLFPVRYQREPKSDNYVNVFH